MGSREVPFDKDEKCDLCGAVGAFDFMGDLLCPACAEKNTRRQRRRRMTIKRSRHGVDSDTVGIRALETIEN